MIDYTAQDRSPTSAWEEMLTAIDDEIELALAIAAEGHLLADLDQQVAHLRVIRGRIVRELERRLTEEAEDWLR